MTASSLFDFEYPYGSSKATIESMIYNHFASYRLSRLDKTKWKTLYFAPRMNEIMPKFNKLYASADLIISPLQNMNWTEGHSYSDTIGRDDVLTNNLSEVINASSDTSATNATSGYTNGNSSSTESSTSDNTNKYSDTPQGAVANLEDGYLSNVTINEDTKTSSMGGSTNSSYVDSNSATGASESESTKTNTGTATRDIDETRSGSRTITHTGLFNGSPAKLMEEYRRTIIDINSMLLNELASMFLQVYDWDEDDEEVVE